MACIVRGIWQSDGRAPVVFLVLTGACAGPSTAEGNHYHVK
jgi:hypothetical protein